MHVCEQGTRTSEPIIGSGRGLESKFQKHTGLVATLEGTWFRTRDSGAEQSDPQSCPGPRLLYSYRPNIQSKHTRPSTYLTVSFHLVLCPERSYSPGGSEVASLYLTNLRIDLLASLDTLLLSYLFRDRNDKAAPNFPDFSKSRITLPMTFFTTLDI